jgi:carboxyl-terminal processing protease
MADYSGADVDKAMKSAKALFADARAIIVDVSLNDGGHDMIARRIAGHFAAERTIAYYKYPGDAGTVERQPIHVEPLGDAPFKGPVFLITGQLTVSAAEIFVLAMRALPNVTQIGGTTDGSLSDILTKPLPNGWSLTLSNEVYLDADGVGWEGRGIPPDIEAEVAYDADGSERDVEAAELFVDHIRALAADAEHARARDARRS